MKSNIVIFIFCLVFLNSCSYKRKLTAKKITLSPLYSSGMVIQTSPHTLIKGSADPNSVLAARISDYVRLITTDSEGRWQVTFPEIILKKPFSIFIEGLDTLIELKNVTTGRMYIVSGDAYLDMIMALDDNECYGNNTVPSGQIRVFKPVLSGNAIPAREFRGGKWLSEQEAIRNPNTCKVINLIKSIATYKSQTIGIVDLTWPGSAIDYWVPGLSDVDTSLPGKPDNDPEIIMEYNDSILAVMKEMIDTCNAGIRKGAKRIWYNDESWAETKLPVNLAKKYDYKTKRFVYLRKKIYVPSRYLSSDFFITIGHIHGQAEYYFNEVRIDDIKIQNGQTQLMIPDTIMRVWTNLLTVKLFCADSLAGIYGTDFICMNTDSTFRVAIDQKWKYNFNLEPDFPEYIRPEHYSSHLFNGLLAPVQQNSYSSFIWYGGYNDVSNSDNTGFKICRIIKELNTENEVIIAYDATSENDTVVYGRKLKYLEEELKQAAKMCNAKIIEVKR